MFNNKKSILKIVQKVVSKALRTIVILTKDTLQRRAGPNCKNPPKIRLKIHEIDWSYLCLQQFDKLGIWSSWNDWKRRLAWKFFFVKSHQVVFWHVLAVWKMYLCSGRLQPRVVCYIWNTERLEQMFDFFVASKVQLVWEGTIRLMGLKFTK